MILWVGRLTTNKDPLTVLDGLERALPQLPGARALMVFGAPHMTGDRLAFATLTTGYLIAAIPWEERSLRQSFGEAYTRYAARVRWRIIPYVY